MFSQNILNNKIKKLLKFILLFGVKTPAAIGGFTTGGVDSPPVAPMFSYAERVHYYVVQIKIELLKDFNIYKIMKIQERLIIC